MADNKNMELNDEMMARATGGMGDTPPIELKFHIGDRVRMKEVVVSGEMGHSGSGKKGHFLVG